jgi:hypothetical protein
LWKVEKPKADSKPTLLIVAIFMIDFINLYTNVTEKVNERG